MRFTAGIICVLTFIAYALAAPVPEPGSTEGRPHCDKECQRRKPLCKPENPQYCNFHQGRCWVHIKHIVFAADPVYDRNTGFITATIYDNDHREIGHTELAMYRYTASDLNPVVNVTSELPNVMVIQPDALVRNLDRDHYGEDHQLVIDVGDDHWTESDARCQVGAFDPSKYLLSMETYRKFESRQMDCGFAC